VKSYAVAVTLAIVHCELHDSPQLPFILVPAILLPHRTLGLLELQETLEEMGLLE